LFLFFKSKLLLFDTAIKEAIFIENISYPMLVITKFNLSIVLMIIIGILFLAIAVIITQRYFRNSSIIKDYEKVIIENETIKLQLKEISEKYFNAEKENDNIKMLNNLYQNEVEKLKEEYKKAMKIAEEADMLKSNFLANMSHEIRTPMNGILGFAQILLNNEMERDKQERYLDIICHNGNMLVNLIDDIMDIAKIEAGQMAISKSEVNLDDLVFDLYTFFNEIKFKQEKEHLALRILNINDDENNVLITDGNRVRQVLSNLINNAIKFTESGVVEFGYINNSEDRNIQFFVRDTGIGIPPDKIELIFEQFRQVEEGTTRKYGGTGIGLFISKHIVNLLGGKIWVESMLGEGTSFFFTIPYESMQQKDEHKSIFHTSKPKYNWKGKVIVIAEDVETNYLLLKSMLLDTNAQVIWAHDGEEVIEVCDITPKVDIVLMDIQMPKINGYEATEIIKKNNKDITIIAQTAYAMPNDNIKCLEAGCDDYISKPINSGLLLKKIDTYLSTSEAKVR
jgi:signal transduction histidine kinase/ActR/RegA family two-component response regulator